MPRKELETRLASLHRELSTAREVDAESRQLLTQLMEDIRELLARSEAAAGNSAESRDEPGAIGSKEAPSFLAVVEDAARRFEASHPKLATTLQNIGETLARGGI